jgi:hypothetical protein
MQESNKRESVWHLFSGVVIADLSILLIGLGGWDVLKNNTRMLIYVSGSILLLCGLFLIWIDAIRLAAARHEPILKSEGAYLGSKQMEEEANRAS